MSVKINQPSRSTLRTYYMDNFLVGSLRVGGCSDGKQREHCLHFQTSGMVWYIWYHTIVSLVQYCILVPYRIIQSYHTYTLDVAFLNLFSLSLWFPLFSTIWYGTILYDISLPPWLGQMCQGVDFCYNIVLYGAGDDGFHETTRQNWQREKR